MEPDWGTAWKLSGVKGRQWQVYSNSLSWYRPLLLLAYFLISLRPLQVGRVEATYWRKQSKMLPFWLQVWPCSSSLSVPSCLRLCQDCPSPALQAWPQARAAPVQEPGLTGAKPPRVHLCWRWSQKEAVLFSQGSQQMAFPPAWPA